MSRVFRRTGPRWLPALLVCLGTVWSPASAEPDGTDTGLLRFTILHTNDEHSTVLPSPLTDFHPELANPTRGGFARLAQAVETLRLQKAAEGEPVLLVSGGDYLSGSAFAWLLFEERAPEVALMVEIGYDVITLGNHEFDYDSERLAHYLRAAGFPAAAQRTAIVASNTVIPEGHPLGTVGIRQTHLQTLDNGLTIGFFGLLGSHASALVPMAPPVRFADPIDAARTAVDALRAAGADVVVAVTHAGTLEDAVLADTVPGIDVIVGGHSHEPLYEPIVRGGTIIVQAGALLEYLGVLELEYDPAAQRVSVHNSVTGQPHLTPLDHTVGEHPDIARRIAGYTGELNAMIERLTDGRIDDVRAVVATADFTVPYRPPLQESPMGNFVTDAMLAVGSEALGVPADFAFQANGVIRGPIEPGTMPHSEGHVTFFDLVDRVGLGFGLDGEPGYPMISVYLTGEEVRRVLEASLLLSQLRGNSFYLQVAGLRARYDPRRAVLARIPFTGTPIPSTRAVLDAERMTAGGPVPLPRGDAQRYHVITDYYLAQFLPLVGEVLPRLGLELKDQSGRPITPEEAIIRRNGAELKVWQAVVEFTAAQPAGAGGLPRIPDRYRDVAGRLEPQHGLPLFMYPLAVLVVVLGTAAALALRRRRIPARPRSS